LPLSSLPHLTWLPRLRVANRLGTFAAAEVVFTGVTPQPRIRMSSGFVSAGTNEEPIERDDEWRKAQEVVEANFRRKQEEGKQDGGKSLYDVLQQNKGDSPEN
jgi:FAM192A/Fyv6, N-terminal domain